MTSAMPSAAGNDLPRR